VSQRLHHTHTCLHGHAGLAAGRRFTPERGL